MRIRNLLMMSAFLAMSGGAWAQTTLTATNAKVVPDYTGDMTLSLTVPSQIAGWQAVISLPAGVTVESESGSFTVNGSTANAELFKTVKLLNHTKNHVVLGGIAVADGDGIAKGDLVLVCFPTVKNGNISDTSKGLCTISLKADKDFTGPTVLDESVAQNLTIKSFQACDADGNPDTTGKFKAGPVSAVLYQLKGDVSGDGKVNITDMQKVIGIIWDKSGDLKGDVTGEGKVNITDIQAIIREIYLK